MNFVWFLPELDFQAKVDLLVDNTQDLLTHFHLHANAKTGCSQYSINDNVTEEKPNVDNYHMKKWILLLLKLY